MTRSAPAPLPARAGPLPSRAAYLAPQNRRFQVRPLSRLLLSAVALVLVVPIAHAQGVNPSTTLVLSGLPASALKSNDTTAVIPVHVQLTLSNLVCPTASDSTFTVALAAKVPAMASATVEVKPATLTFTVPAGAASIMGFSQTLDANVYVHHAGDITAPANVTGGLTANLPAGAGGCQGADTTTTPGAAASGNYTVAFAAPPGVVASGRSNSEPAPGLAVLAVALVALALIVRRRA